MKYRLQGILLEGWLPVGLVAAWWISSEASTSVYFPPLLTIMESFQETWLFERAASDIAPSLARFAAAFGLAMIFGTVLGTVLGLCPRVLAAFAPVLDFARAMPKPALLPIAIVILGIGDAMKISIIAFGIMWPILLNTIDGVRGVDPLQLDMARVYGMRRAMRIRRIILPSASPQIFVGVRLSLGVGLILMVVSEMVASTNGIGYFVLLSQQTFAIPEMWSGIILLGIVGYLINMLSISIEHRALAWHTGWRSTAMGKPVKVRRLAPKVTATIPEIGS